jgi:mono/diheme cytochrome c family protein
MSMKGMALTLALVLPVSVQSAERWYKPAHAAAGKQVYDIHCAACHRPGAVGTPDWRQRDANGLLPPPPLNGTAHAWHHPLAVLYKQIMEGSAPGVGSMPPMQGSLSRGEALAVIAYFQSLWPDEIYQAWRQVDESSRKGAFGQ